MAKKKSINRVGFLLDESGSMEERRQETIVAVNNYFEALSKDKAIVTFATFDTAQNVNFRETAKPATEIAFLTLETYKPNQMTPLHDAIGKMIGVMAGQAEKGDKVLIVIVTDGMENSSHEFNLTKIRELIQKHENEGWAFAYVGAAPDAWAGREAIGVTMDSALELDGSQGAFAKGMMMNVSATSDYFAGRVSNRAIYSNVKKSNKPQ